MEQVKGKSLYSLIKNDNIDDRIIFSALRQTIGAISIAQLEENFTHYDLHSSNILMKPCPKNSVALYLFEDKVVSTPTFGAMPIIIDFGFSYAKECNKKPIHCSLAHTDIGFLSHRYDKYSDAKLLLTSLAFEAGMHRGDSRPFNLFRKLIRKIFSPLDLDSNSGWDQGYSCDLSAIDRVSELTDNVKVKSQTFDRYNHFALDIIQSMISLPLRKKKFKDIILGFVAIDSELACLEKELGSAFFNLYIFKRMILIAGKLRSTYSNKHTRAKAVRTFKKLIYSELDKVSKFCFPNLSFERLLCGIYVYADAVEGVLYQECKNLWKKKSRDYDKLKVKSFYDIYLQLEKYLPDKFQYTPGTLVRVSDSQRRAFNVFKLTGGQASRLNKCTSAQQPELLRKFYEKQFRTPVIVSGVELPDFAPSDISSDDESYDEESSDEESSADEHLRDRSRRKSPDLKGDVLESPVEINNTEKSEEDKESDTGKSGSSEEAVSSEEGEKASQIVEKENPEHSSKEGSGSGSGSESGSGSQVEEKEEKPDEAKQSEEENSEVESGTTIWK